MEDHPNATDWQNRAERAEAYAEELRRDLEEAMDALELIAHSDLDLARGIASETLVAINGRALA